MDYRSKEELVRDILFSVKTEPANNLEPSYLVAPHGLRRPKSFPFEEVICRGCRQVTTLRECWGCHKWFCYDCLIEHMMGCADWQKIKGDYNILFECDKHKDCCDCPYRFKCYTNRKIPKKGKGLLNAN